MNQKALSKLTGILIAVAVVFVLVGLARADDWGFGAGLVPPGISIDFDGGDKVQTGFNVASGGASVSVFKGAGIKFTEFGLDSYFRFEEGEKSNVGFGGHFAGLEKNGWSLFRLGIIGWIERGDNIDWTLVVGIGLPNVYERE